MGEGAHSLTHPMLSMPKARAMYDGETTYPFKVVASYSTPAELLTLLPQDQDELFSCLDLFEKRAQACSFPQLLDDVTKHEVQRFLSDDQDQRIRNAESFPDMLALLFATLATGLQMGQYDKCGGKWESKAVHETRKQCDAFSRSPLRRIDVSRPCLHQYSHRQHANAPRSILHESTNVVVHTDLDHDGTILDEHWTLS